MSLSEAQAVYELLLKIDQLLSGIETKTENLIRELPQTRESLMTFRQAERVALRYVALVRRISGSDRADQLIQILTRVLIIMRMLEISGIMLFSGTPYGILLGIAGIAMAEASMLEGY